MSRFKRVILWFVFGAVAASLEAYALDQLETLQGPTHPVQMSTATYRISEAEREELQIMMINLDHGRGLAWRAALIRAMLTKANWLANRLNLPMRRPIYTTDVQSWQIEPPWFMTLVRDPIGFPDTVFGTDIYNTNFSLLQRILALKFALKGNIATPSYSFSFADGQVWDIVRLDPSESDRYADRFASRLNESQATPNEAAQAYQLATSWLAAADINLAMLEKSRLPHPVHEAQYRLPGALVPQPVYYVDWGTNYFGTYFIYKTWHTNEWHPAVMVKIGPHKELLEMYVGDATFFRNSPMLIPSKIVWRLVHTPDPPLQYLRTPAGMKEFIMTPDAVSAYATSTTNRLWLYQHHQLDPVSTMLISNDQKKLNSELIPYTPAP
jgi:hypothetical protein